MSSLQDTLWVEKYRPETLDDIVGHEHVVERLRGYVDTENMPHLLFAGLQGVGKTAMIQAFCRERYGEGWKNNVMEMNASDERGIDMIRDKVKSRAREGSSSSEHQFQIIWLDESDALTSDAQPALRRIMEDYSDVTRFILSCNYQSQIIGPIQSRCAPFQISPLSDDNIEEVLWNIIENEGLEASEEAVRDLVIHSRGDARKAINCLQNSTLDGELTEEDVDVVVGVVQDSDIREIMETAINGNLDEAFRRLDTEVLKEGVSNQVLADSMLRVIKDLDLNPQTTYKMMDKLAECDWRVRQGANPNVHFHSLLADIQAAAYSKDPYPDPEENQPVEAYED